MNKTVKVEQQVNFKELVDLLEKILPNKEWQKFSLETNVVINNWSSPIIIEKHVPHYQGPYWYCDSNTNKFLCSAGSSAQSLIASASDGTYNLEA